MKTDLEQVVKAGQQLARLVAVRITEQSKGGQIGEVAELWDALSKWNGITHAHRNRRKSTRKNAPPRYGESLAGPNAR